MAPTATRRQFFKLLSGAAALTAAPASAFMASPQAVVVSAGGGLLPLDGSRIDLAEFPELAGAIVDPARIMPGSDGRLLLQLLSIRPVPQFDGARWVVYRHFIQARADDTGTPVGENVVVLDLAQPPTCLLRSANFLI